MVLQKRIVEEADSAWEPSPEDTYPFPAPQHVDRKWCECSKCMAAADDEYDRRRDSRICGD